MPVNLRAVCQATPDTCPSSDAICVSVIPSTLPASAVGCSQIIQPSHTHTKTHTHTHTHSLTHVHTHIHSEDNDSCQSPYCIYECKEDTGSDPCHAYESPLAMALFPPSFHHGSLKRVVLLQSTLPELWGVELVCMQIYLCRFHLCSVLICCFDRHWERLAGFRNYQNTFTVVIIKSWMSGFSKEKYPSSEVSKPSRVLVKTDLTSLSKNEHRCALKNNNCDKQKLLMPEKKKRTIWHPLPISRSHNEWPGLPQDAYVCALRSRSLPTSLCPRIQCPLSFCPVKLSFFLTSTPASKISQRSEETPVCVCLTVSRWAGHRCSARSPAILSCFRERCVCNQWIRQQSENWEGGA